MHDALKNTDDIDNNLYPALVQVFAIVLIGYMAGHLEILTKSQAIGLNKFVSTFALPSLLFKNVATVNFSSVNWLFVTSIFISKSVVFVLAIIVTLITIRPTNIGLAALFAIFVSQSNDFALGYPIVEAVYSQSHPDYLNYIYLLAPISLCILNPISFLMMEANEILFRTKKEAVKPLNDYDHKSSGDENSHPDSKPKSSEYFVGNENEEDNDYNSDEDDKKNLLVRKDSIADLTTSKLNHRKLTDVSQNSNKTMITVLSDFNLITNASTSSMADVDFSHKKKLTTLILIKNTIWSTISNPIVFMTIIGLFANFIFKMKLPMYIEPILTTLGNSFSALALFYLGFTMVGKIKTLKFSSVVTILILIFTKSLVFPLLTREVVLHLGNSQTGLNDSFAKNETDSLSSFGFLYGTFPTAPALFFYISRFKSIDDNLISSALVFGTLASAPLMMISGKMISIKYNSTSPYNFDEIACKTAYGFSFLNLVCCLWVLYIFLASGRLKAKSHRFTNLLVSSQFLNSLVHIIWANITSSNNIEKYYELYVISSLFAAFLTRCWILSIILNILSISGINRYVNSRSLRFLYNLSRSQFLLYFIGFGLPFIATLICVLLPGIPKNQTMLLSIGKPQIITSNILLFLITTCVFSCMIVFARTKNDEDSFLSLISQRSKRTRYYSFLDNQQDDHALINQNRETTSLIVNDDNESGIAESSDFSRSNQAASVENHMDKDFMSDSYQLMQQMSLTVILSFISLMCLFFQMWVLFDESKSGVFYELQLIDVTLLYGQGFFTFLIFGFDHDYILAPLVFKIKQLLCLIKPFKLTPIEQVSEETIQMATKFKVKYKDACSYEIVKNHRFHYKYYRDVFRGCDLIDWLLRRRLIKSRKHGEELGRRLIQARVIYHVNQNRDFHDGFHMYKFY